MSHGCHQIEEEETVYFLLYFLSNAENIQLSQGKCINYKERLSFILNLVLKQDGCKEVSARLPQSWIFMNVSDIAEIRNFCLQEKVV